MGDGGENQLTDVAAVKSRLVELGFSWLSFADMSVDDEMIATIRLFQAIKNGLDVVDKPQNDGLIEVGGATHAWLEARNAPHWMRLPVGSAAEGFIKVVDGDGHDHGTGWLAATIVEAGASYRDTYRRVHPGAALLTINDASLPHGGDTRDHVGHESGLTCDVKLPRLDGTVGGIDYDDARYDRTVMRAMLKALLEQPFVDHALFNDDVLVGEGLCQEHEGHDNHAHIKVQPPERDGF